MDLNLTTSSPEKVSADWFVAAIYDDTKVTGLLSQLDQSLDGQITRLIESKDISGKCGELVILPDVPALAAQRFVIVGLGNRDELRVADLSRAMMTAARKISEKETGEVAVLVADELPAELTPAQFGETTTIAFIVGGVGQAFHKAQAERYPIPKLTYVAASESDEMQSGVDRGRILGDAINLTRELVNRPPEEIDPPQFADRAQTVAKAVGLQCEVFDEARLKAERMGALLAVARGSEIPPRLVVLKHQGADEAAPYIALCGKGVTFDSGGLSLKPSDGMKTMKCDMAGAATVLGAMQAIAELNLPVNVMGLLGLVENMPSGSSYKLGDILTARNGVTIEVLNTDAEGRLVLSDVLSYAVEQNVDHVIDLATLTGACVVALGEEITGAFTNNQDWCNQVLSAAEHCGELIWQLPMHSLFADLLKSDVCDVKNVGPRWGGAITAAKFLEKFVDDKAWVHLDIAGPSFASSSLPQREGGATGCMVRTLVECVESTK